MKSSMMSDGSHASLWKHYSEIMNLLPILTLRSSSAFFSSLFPGRNPSPAAHFMFQYCIIFFFNSVFSNEIWVTWVQGFLNITVLYGPSELFCFSPRKFSWMYKLSLSIRAAHLAFHILSEAWVKPGSLSTSSQSAVLGAFLPGDYPARCSLVHGSFKTWHAHWRDLVAQAS